MSAKPSMFRRYAFAALAIVCAAALRYFLIPVFGTTEYLLITFYLGITASAFYGGLGPGLFATGLSCVAALLFLEPISPLGSSRSADWIALGMFVMIGSAISMLVETLHRETRRADESKRQVEGVLTSLRRKETQLHRVTDVAVVMLTQCSRDRRYKFVNPAYAAMLGLTPEQMIGKPIVDVMGADGYQTILPYVERVLQGHPVEYEHEIPFKGIGPRRLRVCYMPDKDEQGNVMGWVASFIDVTEHKRAQEALQHSDALKAAMLESSLDCIITIDHEGKVVDVNPAVEKIFGYTREHMLGKEMASLIVPPSTREQHRQGLTRYLATGEGPVLGKRLELIAMRANGTEFPVEVAISPIRTSGPPMFTGYVRDITERKRVEEEVRRLTQELEQRVIERTKDVINTNIKLYETDQRLRLLVESVKDYAIIMLDLNGCVTSWNTGAERIKGYREEEILGKHFSCFYPQEDIATGKPGDNLERAAVVGRYEEEGWRVRQDGSRFLADVVITAIKDEAARLIGFSKVTRDITERKEAEEALRERTEELVAMNAELERFAYVSSHDLQEPLRMVASYTKLLAKRYKGKLDADADEYIRYAVEGAERMAQLIRDLLSYSRLGARERKLEIVDCEEVLKRVLTDLKTAIDESAAIVTHDSLPTVTADPVQVGQVFQNLIGNALKFRGPTVPQVHISPERRNGEWLFSVRDNGIGIEPEYAERIFQAFQRLHSKAEYPGSGIGLAICKKIVEGHGGRMWVESTPGQGCTFFFTLPSNSTAP
jgi:PAS domain S-box-containing protein